MRIMLILMLVIISINLSACTNMSGNVVPEKGPTMEEVYDGISNNVDEPIHTSLPVTHHSSRNCHQFHKISNPELTMYVFPHLAGQDEVPIPGYDTAFNVYTQDHYALATEL